MTQAVGNLLARVFLDQLTDRVRVIIDDAHRAGKNLQMEAGKQVELAIYNAKTAYSESLDKTVDKVDDAFKTCLSDLNHQINQVQNQNLQALNTLAQDAQMFLNALPGTKLFPQVQRVSPELIPRDQKEISIILKGNFPRVAQPGFVPIFSLNGYTGKLSANSIGQLEFRFPREAFKFAEEGSIPNFGVITFPKEPIGLIPTFLNPWAREPFLYRVMIQTAPLNPGKLVISWSGDSEILQEKWRRENKKHQGSSREKSYPLTADPGWQIKPETEDWDTLPHVRRQPSPNDITTSRTNNTVTYSVRSLLDFDFEVRFIQTQLVKKQGAPGEEEITLQWGENRVRKLPLGARVVFVPFLGSSAELTGNRLSHRYITIDKRASDISYLVPTPLDVK